MVGWLHSDGFPKISATKWTGETHLVKVHVPSVWEMLWINLHNISMIQVYIESYQEICNDKTMYYFLFGKKAMTWWSVSLLIFKVYFLFSCFYLACAGLFSLFKKLLHITEWNVSLMNLLSTFWFRLATESGAVLGSRPHLLHHTTGTVSGGYGSICRGEMSVSSYII